MNVAEMVKLVQAQGKTEKPTKGFTSWTTSRDLAEVMKALGFSVEAGCGLYDGRPTWRYTCNGNRSHAIIKLLRAAGAQV